MKKTRLCLVLAIIFLFTGFVQDVQLISAMEKSNLQIMVSGAVPSKEEDINSASNEDKSNLLTDFKATVSQNGEEITGDKKLDSTQDINIRVSFKFPVIGDDNIDESASDTYISGGDYATIQLPDVLELVELKNVPLIFGGVEIGQITKDESTNPVTAKVTFSDNINDSSIHSAEANFSMKMRYNGDNDGDSDEEKEISIYDKTLTIFIPAKKTTITADKSGNADISTRKITWKIRVNVNKEGGDSDVDGADGDLKGYTFVDNLTNVGELVSDDFKVTKDEAGADVISTTPVYDDATKELRYTFEGEGVENQCIGTRWIFFSTEIPKDSYYTNGKVTISNKALIEKDGEIVLDDIKCDVPFTMDWIQKSGKPIGTGMGPDGVYDPNNRQIEWEIIINGNMPGAILEDTLPEGLTFTSATMSVDDGSFADITASIVKTQEGNREKLTYNMGDIGGKYIIRIVTNLTDSSSSGQKELVFDNLASIKGKRIISGWI